ncbi:hypothetical protein [Acrocarpospora catenulata]|uniref:hypothetical protein n=1 Tax=Acrocarpospora catenulata TaxID=2836182 RepID=UPI001BDB6229|nr:hypothetical protein [Acrocarpospora catenulata]
MERPKSPLNLRIALAAFGLIVTATLAALAALADWALAAAILSVIAAFSIGNLATLIYIRSKRGGSHSLFE